MKLNFTIENRNFIAVLKAVGAVTDECLFLISDKGIEIKMIDASNAAMVVVAIAPIRFESFEAEDGTIGIDIREVHEKAATFAPEAKLVMSYDGYNKRFIMECDGARYGIKTIAETAMRKIPNMPNMDLPLEVEIEAARLKQMIKRASLVSDHIMIGHSAEEEFFVSAEGDTNNFQQGTITNPVKVIYKEDLVTLYSIDMLDPMSKISTGLVNVRLGRDLPLIMNFDIDGIEVTYLLAPRIEKIENGPEV